MALTPKTRAIGFGGLAAALAISVPFIAQHEGLVNHVYHDVGGVLTVCYGHTGPDIAVHKVYSDDQCTTLLDKDVKTAADPIVTDNPALLNKPYVLGATISFVYNVGFHAYQGSSVHRDFAAGRYADGCKDMLKWTFAGGKYSQGLANRRQAEYTICMKGVP